MKIRKNVLAVTLAMISILSGSVLPAYAAVPEGAAEEKAVEEPMRLAEPLTPEGNLTLVDDIGSETAEGKQFITLVTKNGNYFYLIIDRDAEGKQTVHFLNQVDEADLMHLMDEEEIKELGINDEEPLPEEIVIEETEIVKEVIREETTIPWGTLFSGAVVATGIIAFVMMKKKEKKKADNTEPAEVEEDEEYYDFSDLEQEFDEDEFDEE